MGNDKEFTCISEEVLEVRFVPKGAFLNSIGEVADYIVDKGVFPHWRIDANTINFFESEADEARTLGYASFRNAGYVAFDSPTRNFFKDKALSFWKVFRENPYFKLPQVLRVGVRNKCFVKLSDPFETIEQRLATAFFRDAAFASLPGTRKDLQVTLDLEQPQGVLRAVVGPLHRGEAEKHFRQKSPHFDAAGIFIDLDAFWEGKELSALEVERFARDKPSELWATIDGFVRGLGV